MIDIAVIIVTWNVRHLIGDCLTSLLADLEQSGLVYQVIVVDSASTDDTLPYVKSTFPQVTVIENADNVGFGGANNQGLNVLGFNAPDTKPDDLPRAVYLLNPDTITERGATKTLYDALFANAKVGLVGAQLAYEDGTFQHGAFAFPGLKQLWVELFPVPGRLIESSFNGRYPRELYHQGNPFDIDFPLGATMMLKREVVQATGGFDPQFFMYCEEIDWAWRIQQAGWRVQCVPAAQVTHLAGKSTGQIRFRSFVNLWDSRLKLYKRIHPRWKFALSKWLILVGMRRKRGQASDPEAIRAIDTVIEKARNA